MFVVAVAATIIASKTMISRTFFYNLAVTLIGMFFSNQNCSHISQGQVYILEINYMLMLVCIGVFVSFRTTEKNGNTYDNTYNSDYAFNLYLIYIYAIN